MPLTVVVPETTLKSFSLRASVPRLPVQTLVPATIFTIVSFVRITVRSAVTSIPLATLIIGVVPAPATAIPLAAITSPPNITVPFTPPVNCVMVMVFASTVSAKVVSSSSTITFNALIALTPVAPILTVTAVTSPVCAPTLKVPYPSAPGIKDPVSTLSPGKLTIASALLSVILPVQPKLQLSVPAAFMVASPVKSAAKVTTPVLALVIELATTARVKVAFAPAPTAIRSIPPPELPIVLAKVVTLLVVPSVFKILIVVVSPALALLIVALIALL